MLNFAYNILCGGTRLEDIERLRHEILAKSYQELAEGRYRRVLFCLGGVAGNPKLWPVCRHDGRYGVAGNRL